MKKILYFLPIIAIALTIVSCNDGGKNKESDESSDEMIANTDYVNEQGKPKTAAEVVAAKRGNKTERNTAPARVSQQEWDEVVEAVTKEIEQLEPEDVKKVLLEGIDVMNQNLPLQLGPGLEITSVYIQDNAVQYLVKCDEKTVTIDELKKELDPSNGAFKDIVLGKDNPQNVMFAQLCKSAGYDIIYNFQAIPSQQTYPLKISNSEL